MNNLPENWENVWNMKIKIVTLIIVTFSKIERTLKIVGRTENSSKN